MTIKLFIQAITKYSMADLYNEKEYGFCQKSVFGSDEVTKQTACSKIKEYCPEAYENLKERLT